MGPEPDPTSSVITGTHSAMEQKEPKDSVESPEAVGNFEPLEPLVAGDGTSGTGETSDPLVSFTSVNYLSTLLNPYLQPSQGPMVYTGTLGQCL